MAKQRRSALPGGRSRLGGYTDPGGASQRAPQQRPRVMYYVLYSCSIRIQLYVTEGEWLMSMVIFVQCSFAFGISRVRIENIVENISELLCPAVVFEYSCKLRCMTERFKE